MSVSSSQQWSSNIFSLNEDLALHARNLELMFEGGNLLGPDVVETVNKIWFCAYHIHSHLKYIDPYQLEHITPTEFNTIKSTIANLFAVSAGAIEHYQTGDKDMYYLYLIEKIEPWVLAYQGQKHVLDNL